MNQESDWNPTRIRAAINNELTDITTLYHHLPDEAANHPNDHNYPGGQALHLHGPAANLEAWEHQHETAEHHGNPTSADDQYDTDTHPLLVLSSWEDIIRQHRNQPTDLKATVDRAAAYLRHSLDWALTTDDTGRPNFLPINALLTDLRKVRHNMEALLRDGEQIDRGAPCLRDECAGTLLIKTWGTTTATDTWHCPECRMRYDHTSYILACHHAALTHADQLTATQLCSLHGIKQSTLRTWAERGQVRKHGRDTSGRTLYDVNDALNMRDNQTEATA